MIQGTCYEDAWRFLLKQEDGYLIHGSAQLCPEGPRIDHAWVELTYGWVWEPQTGQYFTIEDFKMFASPIEDARYSSEEAAMMVARAGKHGPWSEEEKRAYLQPNYAPPEQKYRLVKRTKRGSLVVIQHEGNMAKLEITSMEDTNDITRFLYEACVMYRVEHCVSKGAWEGAPAHLRTKRDVPSIKANYYPGLTITFDYGELERILAGLRLQPLMLE